MSDNPAVVLFDVNGNPMAVSGGMSLPTGTIGLMMAAVDSNGFVRFLSTISGSLQVTGSVVAQVTFPPNQQVWQQGPVGVSGSVALTNWPAVIGVTASAPVQVWSEGPLGVSGTVGVSNFPATQNVSGTVFVTQTGSFHVTVDNPTPPPANQQVWQAGTVGVSGTVQVWSEGPLPVSGTVSVSQPVQVYSSGTLGVSGSVAITNWPAVVGISGSVGVTNFPATQNVSGTVFVTQTGSFHVTIDNSELAVSNFPATQAVSGSVSVYTTGLQGVSGTVQVWSEGPLPISGTVFVTSTGSLPVTGSVGITNQVTVTTTGSLPVHVDSEVSVANFPATQNVSGTVNVGNSILQPVPVTITGQPIVARTFDGGIQGVSGSVNVYTSGLQGVSGTVQVWSEGPLPVSGTVFVTATGSLPVAPGSGVIFTVQGNSTTGSAAEANPILVAGADSTSTKRTILTDTAGAQYVTSSFTRPLYTYPTSQRINVMSGGVITANGSYLVDMWPAWTEWYLLANLSGTVGGTNPTIQFYVDQVDPIDKVTQVTARVSGAVMTGRGVSNFQVVDTNSDTFRIGWIVTGTNPVFSGVNIAWVGRAAGSAVEGQAPVGTSAEDPPVLVAGVDDTNAVQYIHADSAGNLHVITQAVATSTTASLSPGFVLYGGSAGVQTAVRGTTYTEQTGSAQRSLKSTSASDSATGTGAQQVQITYYDTNGNGPLVETVSLNGLTAVNTVNSNIRYIEKMVVTRVGAGGSNVGTISLFTATGGNGGTIGSIAVGTIVSAQGDNQTLWAHHYVGSLLTGSLVGLTCGTNGNQSGFVYLRVQNLVTGSNPETFLTDVLTVATAADSVVRTYPAGIPVLGPARITMYVVSNGTNTRFYGSFDWQEHY